MDATIRAKLIIFEYSEYLLSFRIQYIDLLALQHQLLTLTESEYEHDKKYRTGGKQILVIFDQKLVGPHGTVYLGSHIERFCKTI